ncbi:hypothetical protein L7F22_034272 [Adiantum nelumboides]|nr:hypothetical protein [Adiantum nelumboides]
MNHAHGMSFANLGDYTSVYQDEDIVRALEEDFHAAKRICEMLGMQDDAWCHDLWEEKDLINLFEARNVEDSLIREGADENLLSMTEDNNIEGISSNDEVIVSKCELCHVLDSVVDEEEKIQGRLFLFVEIDGKKLCKSTLVSQLNGNLTFSKDRLTKVKTGVYDTFDKKAKVSSKNMSYTISLTHWYLLLLNKHPVTTKAITSALLTLFGGYLTLSKLLPGPGTTRAGARLILDQFLFSPIFIGIFISALMTLEGHPYDIVPKLKQDWFTVVLANWKIWIPFQFLNFLFIPQQLQVLAANVIALAWNTYLSFAAHKDILPPAGKDSFAS